jgi:hypothetical protein
VKLNRTGYADIIATGVTVIKSSTVTGSVPITHQPSGLRNVVVSNPDGQAGMMVTGFTVSQAPETEPIIAIVPNGGANWKQGSIQTVKWSYTGSPRSKVKIELLKGTTVNQIINASTSISSGGLGSCIWTVPCNQFMGTDFKIRITSASNASYTDKSDANFTISAK